MPVSSEPYPNAPIVLVAVEVRYPDMSPRVNNARPELRDRLSDILPLQNDLVQEEFQVSEGTVRRRRHDLNQFMTRDKTTAATFAEDRLIVETTVYPGYENFSPLLDQLFEALAQEVKPTAVERVGLRYIDEVRVDSAGYDPAEHGWEPWIQPNLLGSSQFQPPLENLTQLGWRGRIDFEWDPSSHMVLRYGPGHGYATEVSRIPKRKDISPPGSYFLIDLDCYWEATDDAPLFHAETVSRWCRHLHDPIRSTFEAAITDRYRDEILRGEIR